MTTNVETFVLSRFRAALLRPGRETFYGRVGGGSATGMAAGKGRFPVRLLPPRPAREAYPTSFAPPRVAISGTGTLRLRSPAGYRFVDDVHGLHRPEKQATASGFSMVAESPICAGGFGQGARPGARGETAGAPRSGGGRVVNLIHDDRGDAGEGVAGGAGERVERLGGGDEDVGWVADKLAALAGGVSPLRTTVMRAPPGAFSVSAALQSRDAGQRCHRLRSTSAPRGFEGRNVEEIRVPRRMPAAPATHSRCSR